MPGRDAAGSHRKPKKDLCRRPLHRAGRKMIKRVVPLAALIGGAILAMVLAPDAAWAEKRVALIVGNSSLSDRSAASQSLAGCQRRRQDVQGRRLRFRRGPDQCRQSRIQARDPEVRDSSRSGRHRRRLLRRSRPRACRNQLPHPDRCEARQRSRRRRRSHSAGAAGVVGGWRQAAASRHSGCLPRQSLRPHHAPRTQGRQSRGGIGPRQGGADQHRHPDRLRGEGRLDRR